MKNRISLKSAVIVIGGMLLAGAATSFPNGVPVPSEPPLSCSTPSGWTVTLESNTGGGNIPFAVPCVSSGNQGKSCSGYKYRVTGGSTPDHILLTASADQDLDALSPGNQSSAPIPGAGDSKTDYLKYAQHEYPIRLNPTPGVPVEIYVVGNSKPRISTVVMTKGRTTESCLIAGPGTPGDPFQPVFQSQTALVAGGKCLVNLSFDTNGNVVDVNPAAGSTCIKHVGPVTVTIGNETGPLRNNTGPHGITFGNGTTTCYGPPVPSIPRCICTAAPCP